MNLAETASPIEVIWFSVFIVVTLFAFWNMLIAFKYLWRVLDNKRLTGENGALLLIAKDNVEQIIFIFLLCIGFLGIGTNSMLTPPNDNAAAGNIIASAVIILLCGFVLSAAVFRKTFYTSRLVDEVRRERERGIRKHD